MTVAGLAQTLGMSAVDVASASAKTESGPIDKQPLAPANVKALLQARGVDYRFRTIAHINLRGGIGKTTASTSLALRAAHYGFQTCLLDLDPQGSASLAYDALPEPDDPIFYDVWSKPEDMLTPALRQVDDSLYLLPSSLENSMLDSAMANPGLQKNAVRNSLAVLQARGFDLAVIDCPPSLGTAVISTICAADIVVIPVWSDPFSLKGLELTVGEIQAICDTFGIPAPAIRVLYARYDRRERISERTLDYLRQHYADLLLPDIIRTSSEFSKALAKRQSVFASRRKNSAADDYDSYVRSLLNIKITPSKPEDLS